MKGNKAYMDKKDWYCAYLELNCVDGEKENPLQQEEVRNKVNNMIKEKNKFFIYSGSHIIGQVDSIDMKENKLRAHIQIQDNFKDSELMYSYIKCENQELYMFRFFIK